MSELNFRGRPVRPLAFGTSGLRGLVDDLTDLEAWVNTTGFLEFSVASGLATRGCEVAVAGDLRPSTPRILRAVRRAILDAGFRVVDCGHIPTPALSAYSFARGLPSVMVTGSHIPFDRNGIKFNRPRGEVLKGDEPGILGAVAEVRARTYRETKIFDDAGGLLPAAVPEDPAVEAAGRTEFLGRYFDFFSKAALQGLKIAVYQHSAVGRDLLVELLQGLGAEVIAVGRSDQFIAVDTEAVDDAMVQAIMQAVGDRRVDAVLSTDGDSDRPLVIAVEEGVPTFVRGDALGTMVAEDLDADAVAIPVSVSDLADRHLEHRGVALHRTRIGSPWVIEAMSRMEGARKMGFEANGGFLLETEVDREGRRLSPLPTRDAFLPIVSVLARAVESGMPLGERVRRLPRRFSTAGLVDAVPRAVALAALAPLTVGTLAEAWPGLGRFRAPEGHPRSANSEMHAELRALADKVEARFASLKVGALKQINWVDGIRMTFDGGDVIHLRASGNAPQFRLYATADTMERAKALVTLGLSSEGPVTRMLEEARARGPA